MEWEFLKKKHIGINEHFEHGKILVLIDSDLYDPVTHSHVNTEQSPLIDPNPFAKDHSYDPLTDPKPTDQDRFNE